jgi:hypothetical protein
MFFCFWEAGFMGSKFSAKDYNNNIWGKITNLSFVTVFST